MNDTDTHTLRRHDGWSRNPSTWLVLAILGLVAFSEYLASNRIFQVDEIQYVFTARLLATKQAGEYAASANLMLLGPMTWLAGSIDRAALLLRAERLLFFGVFWVNLWLIVRCAGLRLRSRKGLLALFIVATLAPLWDYGFEIRHETPLLTVILLVWSFARPLTPDGRRRLLSVGFLCAVGQFLAFKAFIYVIPVALFGLVAAVWEERRPLARAVGELLVGALIGFACALAMHFLAGTWSFYASDTKAMSGTVFKAERYSAAPTLLRLVVETPLLLVGVGCALFFTVRDSRLKSAVSRDSLLPEAALLTGAVVAILANPTPFPYNLVLLVPQAAIFCLRLDPLQWSASRIWKTAVAGVLVLHVFIWLFATRRHLYMSNERQTDLMTTAEEMTDPKIHAVLDGSGLVPTRHPPGRFWLIHTFTIASFLNGTYPSIRSQLAEGKTPVVIPNYRLAWLARTDKEFIRQHYVPLAGDFLVAGTAMPRAGRTEWECPVSGRYYLEFEQVRGQVSVDGRPSNPGMLYLAQGSHTLDSTTPLAVVWLGPRLDAPPSLGPGSSARVFVNWY